MTSPAFGGGGQHTGSSKGDGGESLTSYLTCRLTLGYSFQGRKVGGGKATFT